MKNKEIKLVNELFELWESFAQAGELSIGYGFNENYKRLKEQVLILNKVTGSLPKSIEPVSLIIEQAIKRADFAVQALKDIEDKLKEQKTVIVNKNQCDTER